MPQGRMRIRNVTLPLPSVTVSAVFPALSVVRIVLLVSDCAHTTSPQQTDPRICPSSVHLLGHLCVQFCDPCKPRWHHPGTAVSSKLTAMPKVVSRSAVSSSTDGAPASYQVSTLTTHSPSSSSAAHRIINSSPPRLLCDPFPIVLSLTQADPPRPDCICGEFIVRVSCAPPPAALGLSHAPRFPVARSSSSTRA